FERTTADDPFRRGPVPPPVPVGPNRTEAEASLIRAAQDPESGIDRVLSPPAARSWSVDGWVTVAPVAADPSLDRLAGARLSGAALTSSARYQGRPGFRASSAFDGDRASAWVTPWYGTGHASIGWTTPAPRTLRAVRVVPSSLPVRRPATVRFTGDSGSSPPLPVGPGGSVVLPRPLRGRSFRMEVVRAGAAAQGLAPAVGVGELRGAGVPRVAVPRSGRLHAACGEVAAT